MLLPILRWPDPRLSQPCLPAVLDDDLRALAADMLETMYAAPGRGLSAPQVGAMRRLFVMDVAWKDGPADPMVLINPEVLWLSDELALGPEGCLSIPGVVAEVERSRALRLRWTGLDGVRVEALLEGFAAVCAQHELDHLDGIVTLDRLSSDARATALAGVLA
ncbi:peptide deformylase [Tabrizicola sp.]|uniref:peptide deformylase n=1 Tax=Tabrizicola sp. TaxID=2005166 RepID=UPI00286B92A8|nr:peptide deformylase [Tabrizicola sp.]